MATTTQHNIDNMNDGHKHGKPSLKHGHVEAEHRLEHLRIDLPTAPPRHAPTFQYPLQLISFSYSPERILEFTNSALKYYVDPPYDADLSYAYDTWIKREEERGRLDGLLTACLRDEVSSERNRANVISWRGVMTKILIAPYEEREGWQLNVMCVNNTIYLEEHANDEMLAEKENMTPRNRLLTYFGYAFESYCASATSNPKDDPARLPNGWSGNVNTNVQWCSVVRTKLGDNRLILGGEVDCVQGRYTGQPNTFVELKTSLVIRDARDEARFEKKLLKFYFQSFLLGVPEIKVGFRTQNGRLRILQTFKTVQLPRVVRSKPGAWDPNICLDFGNNFISFLKTNIMNWDLNSSTSSSSSVTVHEGSNEYRTSGNSLLSREELVWRVTFYPGEGAELVLLDDAGIAEVHNGEDRVGFLPRPYWEKVKSPGLAMESSEASGR